MHKLLIALVAIAGSFQLHAAEACGLPPDELARWDRADRIVESLPKIFRYLVTIDESRRATIVEPRCVVSAGDDPVSWSRYVARGSLLHLLRSRTMDVTYPAWIKWEGGEAEPHRVVLEHFGSTMTWYGEIIRDEQTLHPFALKFGVWDCARSGQKANVVRRRHQDGRITPRPEAGACFSGPGV